MAENQEAREIIASVYVPLKDIAAINEAVNDGKAMDAAVAAWTEAHADLLSRRFHSRLSASTGSSRAAARAGRKPKTMPISVEDRNASTMVGAE